MTIWLDANLSPSVGPWIAEQVDLTARSIDGVDDVETDLVFSPAWTPELMSEDAKFALGF